MLLMSLLIPLQAFADTTVQSASNGSHTFKDNWTKTIQRTYRNSKCVLTYGYNRTAINEDMAYAYTDGAKHRSRIKNGNGWSNGPWKYANIWSDLEVRHKGSTVKYYHVWN